MTKGSAALVLATHSPREVWDTEHRDIWEDWRIECLCGPTEYTREEYATHQAEQLAFVADVVQETVAAGTPCTTADCEEPGIVPGVYDDGDCHERVVYCAGCAELLARSGEFVPDRA